MLVDVNEIQLEDIEFDFQYWIPQNQLNDGMTDFYTKSQGNQYAQIFFYIILVLTGNDIVPQTSNQILLCTILLFAGAIMVATLFGSISAEIQRAYDEERQNQCILDFVYFSLMIHEIEPQIQYQILSFLHQVKEYSEVGSTMNDLFDVMNPGMHYEFLNQVYYQKMKDFEVFEHSQQSQLMFLLGLMKSKFNISDEEIITQGDEADLLYIIQMGEVKVFLNQSVTDEFSGKIVSVLNAKKKFNFLRYNSKQKKQRWKLRFDQFKQYRTDKYWRIQKSFQKSKRIKSSRIHLNYVKQSNDQIDQQQQSPSQSESSDSELSQKDDVIQIRQNRRHSVNPQMMFKLIKNSSIERKQTGNFKRLRSKKQIQDPTDQDKAIHLNKIFKDHQKKNLKPKINTITKFAKNENKNRKPIQRLQFGEVFGEIGLLTNLKRTCSILTMKTSIFQTLTRENLQQIQQKFPNIHNSLEDHMQKYVDEDMFQKRLFINNIKYLQGLDISTINQIMYLMKEQVYEKGEVILNSNSNNDQILFVWEGKVQVRVERMDDTDSTFQSHWLTNLKRGACISIFKCFSNQKSLVSYIAVSTPCILLSISAKDLEKLGSRIVALQKRIKIIKLKQQKGLLGDIDYITFPKKYIQIEFEKNLYQAQKYTEKNILAQKKEMIKAFQNFCILYKKNLCKIPEPITLLYQLRQDFIQVKQTEDVLMEQTFQQHSKLFNIRGVYKLQKWDNQVDRIDQLQTRMQECYSCFEFHTQSSIRSNMSSEGSIKCQSFHTNDSVCNLKKKITFTRQLTKQITYQTGQSKYRPPDSDLPSVRSSQIDSMNFKNKLRKEIEYDMKKWKNNRIQYRNANAILCESVTNSRFILDTFVKLIEEQIFKFHNFEMLHYVITQVRNESIKYQNNILIANSNLEAILNQIEPNDIQKLIKMIESDDDLIIRIKMKDLSEAQEPTTEFIPSLNVVQYESSFQFSGSSSSFTEESKSVSDSERISSSGQQEQIKCLIKSQHQNTLKKQQKKEKYIRRETQLKYFHKLRKKDKFENEKNCNMVYTQEFLDDFSKFNSALEQTQRQVDAISKLMKQIQVQQNMITELQERFDKYPIEQ